MSNNLPKRYWIPPSYVLVEVIEKDAIDEITGYNLPAYQKDTYNEQVIIRQIGGNFLQRIWHRLKFGYGTGKKAIMAKTFDNLMTEGERKFKVIYAEDIKLVYE